MAQTSATSCNVNILNDWFAALGLFDKEEEENATVDVSSDTSYHLAEQPAQDESHSLFVPTTSRRSSLTKRQVSLSSCDQSKCHMLDGVCCDCCRCFRHCTCGNPQELPPTCDTPDCSERVCSQCMRCQNHCLCRSLSIRAERKGDCAESFAAQSILSSSSPTTWNSSRRVAPPPPSTLPPRPRQYTSRSDSEAEVDYNQSWRADNIRFLTNDGTVAAVLSSKSDATLQRHTTTFEVECDRSYSQYSNHHYTNRYMVVPRGKNKENNYSSDPPRKSRRCTILPRPKGVAALAEF